MLFKRFFLILFLVLFASISLVFSIVYYSSNSLFETNIIETYSNSDYRYFVSLGVETLVYDEIEFEVEILYLEENLVAGTKLFKCKGSCLQNIPIDKTFFGKYKVIITSVYKGRHYKDEKMFFLNLEKPKFEVFIPPKIYLNSEKGIEIIGKIKNSEKKNVTYTFEIYPETSVDTRSVFKQSCVGDCDVYININSQIVIDKYFVNIYTPLGDLQKSFDLLLEYQDKKDNQSNTIIVDKKNLTDKNFGEYFGEGSKKDLRDFFFNNDVKSKGYDINFTFEKDKEKKQKQNLSEGELVDVKFNFKDKKVKEINVPNLKLGSAQISFEEVPVDKVIKDFNSAVNAFAIDPVNLNDEVDFFNVTFVASGNEMYKCSDYNFSAQNCFGDFIKILDTIPGQEYTITLDKVDPLFVEIPVKQYNVQRGSVTSTATSFNAVIPNSVIMNRTLVLMNPGTSDSNPNDWQYTQSLINSTYIQFSRYAGGGTTTTIKWQAIESSEFYVQRGTRAFTTSENVLNITLSNPINISSSFVVVEGRCNTGTTSSNNAGFFLAEIKTSTIVQIERGQASLCAATASYQVVDYEGSNVQSKRISFGVTGTTLGDSLLQSVNLSNSFLVFGVSASSGNDPGMDTNMIYGEIDSSSSVLFTRSGDAGTSNRDIVYYVIENSEANVQRNTISTTTDITETLTPAVNLSKAFHISTITNSGGGQSYANKEYTAEFTNNVSLFFDKITGSNIEGISWEVVEFFPNSISIGNGVVLNSSLGLNLDNENLTCNYELDLGVQNIFVNWLVNGNSIMSAAYPFEGGALDSLIDYSNNSNNAVNNGAIYNSTGGYDGGGAYEFSDSSDRIEIPFDSSLDLTDEFTVSAWIKASSSGANDYQTILNKEDSAGASNDRNFWLTLWGAAPVGSAHFRFSTSSSGTDCDIGDTVDLRDDSWHYLTATYNGSHCLLYVDSNEVGADSVIGIPEGQGDPMWIGNEIAVNNRGFLGTIDDVRVYNRALSENQIIFNYNDRLNEIHLNETVGKENWVCSVQTFDQTQAGELYTSNSLKIISTKIPNVLDLNLFSNSLSNYTSSDLTCSYAITPTTTQTITSWFLNGESIFNVNLPFEGNETNSLIDYSNNSNNGNNNSVQWSYGIGYDGSGAFNFVGTSGQYINLGQSSSLFYDGDSNYTFSFWIKTTQTLGDSPLISDKDWGLGFNNGYSIFLENNVCKINIGDGFNRVDLDGITVVNDGNWHLCTFVLDDSNNVSLYVDGVLDSQIDMTSINNVNSSLPTVIGNDGTLSYGNLFIGILDNVQIYNRVLSPEQILKLYNNESDNLSNSELNDNDIWMCSVTAFDEFESSLTKYSNNITVFDPPPVISINLTQPENSNIDVYHNAQYDIVFNTTCESFVDCENVNISLNYIGEEVIGESGSLLMSNNNIYTIEFLNTYNEVPIIIATPVTDNNLDNNPLIPVIHSINQTHVVVSLCEDAGATTCSTTVEEEEMNYFLIDREIANSKSWIEVGVLDSIPTDGSSNVFSFNKTFSNIPYVFSHPQTYNLGSNNIAAHSWSTAISTTGGTLIGCDHPGIANTCGGSGFEDYGYVAIDVVLADLIGLSSGTESIASSTWTPVTFSQVYSNPRIIVSQNSDTGGEDPQYPWAQSVTSSGAEVRYCEADAAGVCNTHSAENVVWLTLENGLITTSDLANRVISNISLDSPLYIDSTNPKNFNLNSFESTEIAFPLYFTGSFNTTYEIYATASFGNDSRHFNATILPSYLIIDYISPQDNRVVVQNQTLEILTNVSCVGFCGEIISTSRINLSPISTVINDTPIYTTDFNPVWCNPGIDGYCFYNWTINATGFPGSEFDIDVEVNSTIFGLNDTLDSRILIVSGPEVLFNQTFLNTSNAIASYQSGYGYVEYQAFLYNQTNVNIVCESGDCSAFSTNITNGFNLNVGNPNLVEFSCLPTNSGNYSAIFGISSSEDTSSDLINVSCEATELELYINLINPDTNIRYDILQNSTFNVSVNVTCNQAGGCNNTEVGLYYVRDSIGETGSTLLSNFETKSISFIRDYDTIPVVIPITASDNDADDNPLIPVITDITTTGFNIALCEDAGLTTCSLVVEEEEVHYYVFDVDEVSSLSWIDVGHVNSVNSDGNANAFTFGKTFSNTPYVFVWSNTDNDGGSVMAPTAWTTSSTTTGASLFACDHPGIADVCEGFTTEDYSYLAIDVLNANIGELSYGSVSVPNSEWTSVSFSETYSNPRILVAEVTESGAQDPQYPWARDVTSTGADIRYCEADTGGYCDTHNSETMVYLALEDGLISLGTINNSLVSTVSGTTPYFTNITNPYMSNLLEGTTTTYNFLLNGTGTIDEEKEVYGILSNGIDSEILTIRTVGYNELSFQDTSLVFSDVYQGEGVGIISTTLYSRYENNNVSINCESGDCSSFSSIFNNGNSLAEAQSLNINFICSDSAFGNFSAIFNVSSNDNDISNTINLSCSVVLKPLDIDLIYPNPLDFFNVSLYDILNITFNVSCNNATGCNNVDVYVGYEDNLKNWWNRTFLYKQEISLDSFESSSSNYTFLLNLDSSNVGSKFNWNLMCEDLRFIYNDSIELNYWIESCSFSDKTARIWVKSNEPLTSFDLYNFSIYYGNQNVTTTSDGYDTFLFFDDFENYDATADGIIPSSWTSYTSGNILLDTESNGNRALLKTTNDDPSGGYASLGKTITNYEAIWLTNRINDLSGTANRYSITDNSANGYGAYVSNFGASSTFILEERAVGVGTTLLTGSTFSTTQNTWYKEYIKVYNGTINHSFYDLDGILLNTLETTDLTTNSFTRFYVHGGQEFLTDDIAIREIMFNEPLVIYGDQMFTYSQISNESKAQPLYIIGNDFQTYNLINGESILVDFNLSSYTQINSVYEVLGFLSNNDRTDQSYFNIRHPKTNLGLNYNVERITDNLFSVNLTLSNEDFSSVIYNKSIRVYAFVSDLSNITESSYSNSLRYNISQSNESLNDEVYSGKIYEWVLSPNLELEGVFSQKEINLNENNSWNLIFNITSFGNYSFNNMILIGFDPDFIQGSRVEKNYNFDSNSSNLSFNFNLLIQNFINIFRGKLI